jgi:prolipoprotein diacylglyceryltransferase/protein-S-isoprenylcysteine O-methyltransferase Ste14
MGVRATIGKLMYGSLFVFGLPGLLWLVANRLDATPWASWPVPVSGGAAIALGCLGTLLIVWSMWLLWTEGKGLPMNAYPTKHRVSRSTYRWVAHPIYTGFGLCIMGYSGWIQSPTGFWLLTPICALASCALVAGYEGPKDLKRLGRPSDTPWLGLPPPGNHRPTQWRALCASVISLGPFAFLYWALSHVPTPPHAMDVRMAWEYDVAQPDWAFWVYSALYPVVVASAFLLTSYSRLRQWVLASWVCTFVGFACMVGVPNQAEFIEKPTTATAAWLLQQNRLFDAEWMAAPSFHAAWAALSGAAFGCRWPRLRWLIWVAVAVVGASCVLTGSHGVVDVLLGLLLGLMAWRNSEVWAFLVGVTERLGNSWSSWRVGPFRIISHFIWSFLAATVGALTVLFLAGSQSSTPTIIALVSGLAGAAVWGYWMEGGHRLSRPFGYYGYLLASMLTFGLCFLAGIEEAGILTAACAAAAPFAQAIGRLRCVVQGCCHGRPVLSAQGIRVRNAMSRVTAMADLGSQAIHPTQLYSIVANLFLGLLLLRMWKAEAPWSLIGGLYLVLSSLARFTEEHFRGEPQTVVRAGLTVYQWLAALFFVAGLALIGVPAQAVSGASWFGWGSVIPAIGLGTIAALMMSVDFPESTLRFSRLTVDLVTGSQRGSLQENKRHEEQRD